MVQSMKAVHYFEMLETTHPVVQLHVSGDRNPWLRHSVELKIRTYLCCLQSVFGGSIK
jgi:hypothetical protein